MKETSPQHFLLDSELASGDLIVAGHIHIDAIHHPNLKATLNFQNFQYISKSIPHMISSDQDTSSKLLRGRTRNVSSASVYFCADHFAKRC